MQIYRQYLVVIFITIFISGCMPAVHDAVLNNDIEKVSSISKSELYEIDKNGMTAIHFAIKHNKKPMLKVLVNNGFDINQRDNYGRTPLSYSIELKSNANTKELLFLGANPNLRNSSDEAALHVVAKTGNIRMLEILLDSNADINSIDRLKRTPLHWAVYNNHLEVVKILVNHGAKLMEKDKFKKTPLDIITSKSASRNIFEYYLSKLENTYIDSNGNNILHLIARSGDIKFLENAVQTMNVDSRSLNYNGEDPFQILQKTVQNISLKQKKRIEEMKYENQLKEKAEYRHELARRKEEKSDDSFFNYGALAVAGVSAAIGVNAGISSDKVIEISTAAYIDSSEDNGGTNLKKLQNRYQKELDDSKSSSKKATSQTNNEESRNRQITIDCQQKAKKYSDGDGQTTPHCQQAISNKCLADSLCKFYPDKCSGQNRCPACR